MSKKRTRGDLYVITKTVHTNFDHQPVEVSVVHVTKCRKSARAKLQALKNTKRAHWLPKRYFDLHPVDFG